MPWGKQRESSSIQCSLVHSSTVYIEPIPRSKIQLLMEEYPHQEWLGYLVGRISDKMDIFVEGLSIPPHKSASGASAEAEPFHIPENCVGIIHSHHSMGAFHSSTDQAYVDKNYPVSITVAFNGSKELVFDAVNFVVTPCKKATTLKATVRYVQPKPMYDTGKFIKEARANIDKGKEVRIVPKQVSFFPVRYKKDLPYSDFKDTVVDQEGRVMTQEELEKIYKQIWRD